MKRLGKKAEPLALVHHCMAFKAVPVTTAGAHPEVVTGPVALAGLLLGAHHPVPWEVI